MSFNADHRSIRLAGAPGEMGFAHGRAVREQVQRMVEQYVHRSEAVYEVPTAILKAESLRCLPHIPTAYTDEMRAIAEGSGTEFEDILALNCLSDVDGCHMEHLFHCCNFVAGGRATVDGRFFHGRNLDFPTAEGVLADASFLFIRQPEEGILTAGVGFAGFAGFFTGYSAEGVTVGEVSVPAKDATIEGMPMSLLLRHALESTTNVDGFYDILKSTPRTCGYNIAVTDGKSGECLGIELTRNLCEKRTPTRDVLVVDDVCLCKKTAHNRLTFPAGVYRYARMVGLLAEHHGAIDEQRALAFLADNYDLSCARKRFNTYNTICNRNTIHSVLFMPAEGRILLAHGSAPAPLDGYIEYKHDELFTPRQMQ